MVSLCCFSAHIFLILSAYNYHLGSEGNYWVSEDGGFGKTTALLFKQLITNPIFKRVLFHFLNINKHRNCIGMHVLFYGIPHGSLCFSIFVNIFRVAVKEATAQSMGPFCLWKYSCFFFFVSKNMLLLVGFGLTKPNHGIRKLN